ncbi:MAG: non-ribosomal peptide synthetase, partial [Selenomonadaceae bacterium]|nr:non-ribosomal peptide synthetase [Selenomonadaceae bacterium]
MMGTLIDVFLEQVDRNPQHVAVMDAHGAYTYAQLNRRSAILARHLLDKQQALKTEGKRMAVLLPRSRDFLVAMLGILRAGCAAVPLDSEYPAERINTILEDAGCSLCISTGELSSKIEAVSLLNLDENLQESRNVVDESLNLSDPAVEGLLLFTSGSTGKPKGVVHRQSIFSSGAHVLKGYHEFTKKDVTCCMAGFTFVVSTNDLYAPLTGGGSVYIADEMERKNVALLYQIIKKHGVTGMYLPPQMFNVMRELYGRLPLEYILLSGEKVQTKYAADNNLLEFYGSTETVGSLVHRITDDSHRTLGKPCGGAEVYLLSESGERITEPKAVGEFCVAGPYVAIGYNNLPEETAAKFTENPFKAGGGLLYHSGDYMALDEEGNLIFHGRKDRMIKLRGYRVELGEIENAMMRAEGVSEAACVLIKVHGSDKLCCYYAGEKTLDASAFAAHGKNVLPEYMVPDYFVCLEKLPRNERNKVNYLALPGLDLAAARENVPPETEAESKIFEVAAEILGTKEFGVTDDLVSLGLTSIGAMRLAAELSRACALHIPVAEILRTPTIRALAAYAEGEIPGAGKKFSPHLKRKLYPITENQRGIIIDWEQNCGSTQYNIPAVTVFDGVEGESLVCAVKAALDAHGYLKTRFLYAEGDVMQQRREEDASVVSLTELAKEPDRAFFQDRVQPFDLFSERLYRLEVYTFGKRAWLFSDIHHTVYDGLSGNVFLEEVRRALAGEKLRGERLTAYDFALYEQELCGSETYAEAKAYFDKLAEGAVPAVLPDSTKPDGKAAGTFTLQMPAEEINDFCQSCAVTPGSFFEAAFWETLRRLTREEKPFYLTVSSGRSAFPSLMDSVGMFVKTLPVMLQNPGDMTAKEYVGEVHRQLQETYKREIYPYTELVENHGL